MKKLKRIFTSFALFGAVIGCSCGLFGCSDGSEGLSFSLQEDGTYWLSSIDGCESKKIVIPEEFLDKEVSGIGASAFSGVDRAISIVLPKTVKTISKWAFKDSAPISKITVDGDSQYYKDVDGDLYTKDGTALVRYASAKEQSEFVIFDEVLSVEAFAFYGSVNLQKLDFGEATSFGDGAFENCSNLKKIVLNNDSLFSFENYGNRLDSPIESVVAPAEVIGRHFYGYTSLKEVIITSGEAIYNEAFKGCTSLESVQIPNSVTTIGECAFEGCSGLKGVDIPDSVTTIEYGAFSNCDGLTGVVLPNSVTCLSPAVFSDCDNLKSVTIGDDLAMVTNYNGTVSLLQYAFNNCKQLAEIIVSETHKYCKSVGGNLYTKDGSVLLWYMQGKTQTSFSVPSGVTTVFHEAFEGNSYLTSVEIPNSVTTIGDEAFYECSSLTSVEFGDSVTSIGYRAFGDCTNLTSIEIPDSVTTIDDHTFIDCSSLTEVIIGDGVTSIGEGVFYGCSSLTSIEVSTGNNTYSDIDGNIYSKDGKTLILYAPGKTATQFAIPDGVITIGDDAFSHCDSLTNVVIPDSVTSIGWTAFYACSNLTSIYYKGTAEEWAEITIDLSNEKLAETTKYYYSETEPTTSGNYWRYVNGVATPW